MRRSPRLPVKFKAILESEGLLERGTVSDLGLRGAFVTLAPNVKVAASLLTLRFAPSEKKPPLEVLARLVRRTDAGIGLEFLDLEPEQRHQIWASLIPLWPEKLLDCPYCGQQLNSHRKKICPICRMPLEFQDEAYLERLGNDSQAPREMIGTCPSMLQVFHIVRKVAKSDIPVMITGPSGTGKEMVAQALHQRSLRARGPFVVVNCSAIPRNLLESELFGHERGAFTGAYRTVAGKLELADHGSLFLDEVGELPLELQVKLLRFLQDFTFERVGGREKKEVDIRVISATNCNLKDMVAQGSFREDLFYRLNVIHIELPPLKDRGDDIMIMANIFLRRYAKRTGKKVSRFTKKAEQLLQYYSWPGNVREMINHIRRAVVMAEDSRITVENLGLDPAALSQSRSTAEVLGLKDAKARFEARLVAETLARFGGNVQMAAEALKTSRSVVYHLINKHELKEHNSYSKV